MIYKLVFPLIILLLLVDCKHHEFNCSNFKKGSFIQNIEEEKAFIYSLRTDDGYQRDSSKFGVSKYKITWKSNCNYESELIETTNEFSKKHIGRKYHVDIIKVLNNKEYIYKCSADGIDFEDHDTIVKVN